MMQRVDAAEEVLDDLDLVRHLGAAQDRDERPLRRLERRAKVLEFVLHQEAGRRLRQQLRHAFGRGVRAVARPERVVHVEVGQFGQLLRERRVVLLFFRVEADVLEEHDAVALRLRLLDRPARRLAHAVVGERSPPGRAARPDASATGSRLNSGLGPPFGRPRCDARMTVAPCSSA